MTNLIAAGVLLAAGVTAATTPRAAEAKPAPGIDALRRQADQLNTQLEQLTEQYDGLRVRLRQAQRAAEIAKATSQRESAALKGIQQRVGRLAALRYMHSAPDEAPALFSSRDPQALLDQAATLHYFTQQDDTHTHWTVNIGGQVREFDAEITEQHPDERVAWNSTGGDVDHAGVVTFHKLSDAQTRVTVQLDWEPQGMLEKLGSVTGVSTHAVKDELQHFKTYIEQQGTEDGAWRGDVQSG